MMGKGAKESVKKEGESTKVGKEKQRMRGRRRKGVKKRGTRKNRRRKQTSTSYANESTKKTTWI